VNSDQYVGASFVLLIGAIILVGWVLQAAFFRHDSVQRQGTGLIVVLIGAVLAMILINKTVF
jgi:hypothetical protein